MVGALAVHVRGLNLLAFRFSNCGVDRQRYLELDALRSLRQRSFAGLFDKNGIKTNRLTAMFRSIHGPVCRFFVVGVFLYPRMTVGYIMLP